eukprot:Colp12_sorted_trinity150504_noHs@14623
MSVQWHFCSALLWTEITIFLLLSLPMPARWQHRITTLIAESELVKKLRPYLGIFAFLVIILFLDSIREINRFSEQHEEDIHEHGHHSGHSHFETKMRLLGAQRNAYISGFTVFLFLVLNRFYGMMSRLGSTVALETQAK